MKCRGKRDTAGNIPRGITFSPLQFTIYRGKSIFFWDSVDCRVSTDRTAEGGDLINLGGGDPLCTLHRAEGLYSWVTRKGYMRDSLHKS